MNSGILETVARRLGRGLGDVVGARPGRRRRAAERELGRIFPDLDRGARRRIIRAARRNATAARLERLALRRLDAVDFCRRLTLEGWEHLDAAERHGRGVVVLTAPLGMWECAVLTVGLYRGPLDVATPILGKRHPVDRTRIRLAGQEEMRATLGGGGRVAALVDPAPPQDASMADAVEADFFGRPVRVTALPARLALQSGAAVVPVFALPAPGAGYRVALWPAMHPGESVVKEEKAIESLVRRYLEVLEDAVRRWPECWPW